MAMIRRHDARHGDLRPQSRIGLGLGERLLQKPLRRFQIMIHIPAQLQQHFRTLGTRLQVLEKLLEDRTLSLRVAVGGVLAGCETLPAAPDAAAGSGRRQRDGKLGEFRCRPRRATRGRSHGSGLQFVGHPRRRPVRAESKMLGALLRVADELREAAMQRSPSTRVELRLDTRCKQGVAEADTLLVQLHDRRGLGRAKPPAYRRPLRRNRFDDRDRRLAEQRNGLEHLTNVRGQCREARRNEVGERRGDG